MTDLRPSRTKAARRGLSWAVFCGASTLALVAGVIVTGLTTGSRASAAMVLLAGLIVIGIAAALMESIISPSQKQYGRGQGSNGTWGVSGAVGGFGGDGSGAGSCGGDGGGCG